MASYNAHRHYHLRNGSRLRKVHFRFCRLLLNEARQPAPAPGKRNAPLGPSGFGWAGWDSRVNRLRGTSAIIHYDQDSFVADAVKHRWQPSLAAFRKADFLALEQFFHWMPRLRSRRQMLRQVIITSKIANAITVANTVMIVANERTYITPCCKARNILFPCTEKHETPATTPG